MAIKNTETGEVRYAGRTLFLREENGYHDSDFYAYVMEDDGTFRWDYYASTRGPTYHIHASVDATEETWDAYRAYYASLAEADEADRAAAALKAVVIGSTVKVNNRSKHKGKIGKVFWIGPDKYQEGKYNLLTKMRCGIDTGTERIFVSVQSVFLQTEDGFIEPSNAYTGNLGYYRTYNMYQPPYKKETSNV